MTSLLDILREIEPDVGWEAVPGVKALHDEARTAVRMALAGYRAKEKT